MPDVFWRSTLPELMFMVRGWQRARGIDPDKAAGDTISRADYDAVKALYPDTPSAPTPAPAG